MTKKNYTTRLAKRTRRNAIRRGTLPASAQTIAARSRRIADAQTHNNALIVAANAGDATAMQLIAGGR